MNKSAASAASGDYVKFQAVISRLLAQPPLAEAVLATDWITAFLSQFLAALAAKNIKKIIKISDSGGGAATFRALNKSAASTASLDGFSSRDQVGC